MASDFTRVLITGATSGIGLAAARLFAAEGYDVGVLSFLREEVWETVAALTEAGGRAFPVCADLSQPGEAVRVIELLENEGRPLDILVNNAGIGLQADVLETREEDLRRLFEVNFFSAYLLSREALRHMAPRGRGHIVNVSSASARRSLPGLSVYAATKAALHSASQALRLEAREFNVHVTEVLPISVRTPFFEAATNRAGKPYRPGGKTQTPEEVAGRILWAVRYPAPEVYTSTLSRLALAIGDLSPKLADFLIRRTGKRR